MGDEERSREGSCLISSAPTVSNHRTVAIGAIAAVAMLYAIRAAWFFHGVEAAVHFDEGYIAAFGERLLDGRFLPYVDAVSQRGPVLYWLAGIAQWTTGRFEWTGIRHLVFGGFVLASLGVFLAGVAARQALAGAIGSLLFVTIMAGILEEETVFGLLGEPIATPLAMLSMAAIGFALYRTRGERARVGWLALAGALAAIAGLTKQTYLPTIGPLFVWVLLYAAACEPERRLREGLVSGAALVGGWLVPLLAVLLVYSIAGELDAFWYWFYTFNREVYMAPFDRAHAVRSLSNWLRGHGFLVFGLVVMVALTLVRVVARTKGDQRGFWQRLFASAFSLVIVMQLVIAVAASLSPLRFWSQYYLPPVPWVALLLGCLIEAALLDVPRMRRSSKGSAEKPHPRAWGYTIAALLLCGISASFLEAELYGWRKAREAGRWADAYPEPACDSIAEYTEEGEPIFIWGFDSDLYITCRRRSASRYLYSTMVAGVVVPFWRDARPEWVARNAQENLIAELKQHDVAVIIDSPERARGSSMLHVPKLKEFLSTRYQKAGTIQTKDGRKMTRWVRKDLMVTKGAEPKH